MAEGPNIANSPLHQPLPPGNYMRVLSLDRSSSDGERQYSLRCRSIDDSPYLALSYRWQNDEQQPRITVNGRRVNVMQTVKDFLDFHLESRACDEIFIDSICINQQDLKERASQVRLMGQIYSYAAKVCIWLGLNLSAKEHSVLQVALDWKYDGLLPQRGRIDFVGQVFSKDYWKRAWIIQEIVLAREIELFWGEINISEAGVHRSADAWDLMVMNPDLILPLEVLEQRQAASKGAASSSLAVLLCAYGHTKATDVRDKVYAMLSMAANEKTRGALPVDYSEDKTPVDVFCDVMEYCDIKPGICVDFAYNVARSLGIDAAGLQASSRALRQTTWARGWVVGSVLGAGDGVEDHNLQERRPDVYSRLRRLEPDLEVVAFADDIDLSMDSSMRTAGPSLVRAARTRVPRSTTPMRLYPATDLVNRHRENPRVPSEEILEYGDVIVNFAMLPATVVLRRGPGRSYFVIGSMQSRSGWRADVNAKRTGSKWDYIDTKPDVGDLIPVTFCMNLLAVVELSLPYREPHLAARPAF